MKKNTPTDIAIEDLVAATCPASATAREKHVYREVLRGLVRLAKSEHTLEIKTNVNRLTGANAARIARRHAKAILLAQRPTAEAGQKRLEFNQS